MSNCPMCLSRSILDRAIPEHTREWKIDGATFVEHMPEAADRMCRNCGHEWTDYLEQDDDLPTTEAEKGVDA